MADGFNELDEKKLQTHEGVSELNRMLQFLFNAVAGDGYEVRVYSGTGSPLNVVQAKIGSLYLRTDGGGSTTLYVKESGTDGSGWVAK